MLGKLNLDEKRVTIVGGGFAGLVAAYFLDKKGYEVTLYEASDRCGGLIRTERTPWGYSEAAAHSLLGSSEVRELINELGLGTLSLRKGGKSRYILRDGKFRKFPLSIFEILGAIYRILFKKNLNNRPSDPDQMTLAQWADLHLGVPVKKYLLAPMLNGIYGVTPSELVVGAAFPQLTVPRGRTLASHLFFKYRDPSRKKSLKKERSSILICEKGMESLVQALGTHLRSKLGSRFVLSHPVDNLSELPAGNRLICTPSYVAAKLLQSEDPALAKQLRELPYTPLVSVKVFVSKAQLEKVPMGLGVLLAEGEGLPCLGVLFNSGAFEGRVRDENCVSFSLFLGGSQRPEVVNFSDEKIFAETRQCLEILFGFKGDWQGILVDRYPHAIPQYGLQALALWEGARQGWCSQPGNILFGNYTGQVSLRGMIETWSRSLEK